MATNGLGCDPLLAGAAARTNPRRTGPPHLPGERHGRHESRRMFLSGVVGALTGGRRVADAGEEGADGPVPHRYLDGVLDAHHRALLERVNGAGLRALRGYLAGGEAVAFLGAGASAPLYPLWVEVVGELVGLAAAVGLSEQAAVTCRALAATRPDAVVELVRRELGAADYRQLLWQVFQIRRDPATGRTWTATHELVARCAFKAVVTTNYDPGIVDARVRVRPSASGTGFATWADEDTMDRWRTGEVFSGDELPVLYAHGHHNRPEDVVLAATDYRRAYAGKLARVLGQFVDGGHLVWVGFGFADQRITAVIREVADGSGTHADPGGPARHVAIMPWDPGAAAAGGGVASNDPQALATLARIDYGCRLVLYPTPGGDRDHSALSFATSSGRAAGRLRRRLAHRHRPA